jgi:E3 ubiquitin-protein ligase SspH2
VSATLVATLPVLPSSLQALYLSWRITTLPVLPSGLQLLDVSDSQVAALPALPSSLKVLAVGGSKVKVDDPALKEARTRGIQVFGDPSLR